MRTKIIITIGPRSEEVETLKPLLSAGADIVRVNFSHASQEQYKRVRKIITDFNKESGKQVGMLLDLQGPRIRVGKMPVGGIELSDGEVYDFSYSKTICAFLVSFSFWLCSSLFFHISICICLLFWLEYF